MLLPAIGNVRLDLPVTQKLLSEAKWPMETSNNRTIVCAPGTNRCCSFGGLTWTVCGLESWKTEKNTDRHYGNGWGVTKMRVSDEAISRFVKQEIGGGRFLRLRPYASMSGRRCFGGGASLFGFRNAVVDVPYDHQ